MINEKSINTPYDEPLTLVEWLQKTTKALEESVLTNLGIAKLSDQDNIATYQVTATFADNTTIVSDPFILPSTDIVTAFGNLTTLVNGFNNRITNNEGDIGNINNKMLKLPDTTPSTRKVVTIGTNGAQDNVDSTSLTTLMSNIVDDNGNKRFVEGNISNESLLPEGVTLDYGKWSLSGSHLMIVICVKISAGYTLRNVQYLLAKLPSYILDKITALTSSGLISKQAYSVVDVTTWGGVVANTYGYWFKSVSAQGIFLNQEAIETTSEHDRVIRYALDLLIDTD